LLLSYFLVSLAWTTSCYLVWCLTPTLSSPLCDQSCRPGCPVCICLEGLQIVWPSDGILGPSLQGHHGSLCHIFPRNPPTLLVGEFIFPFHCLICVIRQTVLSLRQLLPTPTMSSDLFFLPYGLTSRISGIGLTHLLSPSGTNSPS